MYQCRKERKEKRIEDSTYRSHCVELTIGFEKNLYYLMMAVVRRKHQWREVCLKKRNKRRFGQGGLIDWGACIFHVVRDLWQHSKQDWGLATLSGAACTGRSVANRIEGCAVKNSCRPSRLGLIELHSLCQIRRRHRLFSESLNTSTICLKGWYRIRNSCCF